VYTNMQANDQLFGKDLQASHLLVQIALWAVHTTDSNALDALK